MQLKQFTLLMLASFASFFMLESRILTAFPAEQKGKAVTASRASGKKAASPRKIHHSLKALRAAEDKIQLEC